MRGTVEGLGSRHPIGMLLPGLFQDDEVAQQFTSGLDEVIAPVHLTLDAIESYVDPRLAPLDFVQWLGSWLAVNVDPRSPESRQRELVAAASEIWEAAGTAKGLRRLIEIHTGVTPEIEESGATSWSSFPGGELPGSPEARLTIRIRVPDPDAIDRLELERNVASVVPAHVVTTIEVEAAP